MDMSGRMIALTGGAAGIGAAVRDQLLAAGATVVVLDRNDPQDDRVTYVACDLSDPTSIQSALSEVPSSIDGLANVAGLPGTHEVEPVMRVNFLGLRMLTDGLVDRITKGGSVVHVASLAGSSWQLNLETLASLNATEDFDSGLKWVMDNPPADGSAAYNFSKEAVIYYTKLRARDAWVHGLRVNAVCPGAVATGILADFAKSMAPGAIDWSEGVFGRHADPIEVASLVTFLLSPASSFINGVDIPVDGGLIAGMVTGTIVMEGVS